MAHENLGESFEADMEQPVFAFSADGYDFHKSPESGGSGCVAVAWGEDGGVRLADTKNETQPSLGFNAHEWQVFVGAVKRGVFDEAPRS
jgi:hypothetical protein